MAGRNIALLVFTALLLTFTSCTPRQCASPYLFHVTDRPVYKTADNAKLRLHIFQPQNTSNKRPAIIFFHGGNWRSGGPAQFYEHCRYFASRGMVAVAAEYRVMRKFKITPAQCVTDAKSAVRYLRKNAVAMKIDPDKIVAAGGSAGGHIALCTAAIEGLDEKDEDLSISSVPNALVLYNPVVDTSEKGFGKDTLKDDWQKLSPVHNIKENLPPTIIMHGTADETVPFENVERFTKLMNKNNNDCRLIPYPDCKHRFFNYNQSGDNKNFVSTLRDSDEFLISIGLLEPPPAL